MHKNDAGDFAKQSGVRDSTLLRDISDVGVGPVVRGLCETESILLTRELNADLLLINRRIGRRLAM